MEVPSQTPPEEPGFQPESAKGASEAEPAGAFPPVEDAPTLGPLNSWDAATATFKHASAAGGGERLPPVPQVEPQRRCLRASRMAAALETATRPFRRFHPLQDPCCMFNYPALMAGLKIIKRSGIVM